MAENKKDTDEKQEVSNKPQGKCGCGCTTPPVKK